MNPKEICMTRLSKILEVVAILLVAIAPVAKCSGAQSLGGMLAHKPVQRNAAAPQANTAGSQANTMSVCQARRMIVEEMRRVSTHGCLPCLKSPPSNIAFSGVEFQFQAEPEQYKKLFPGGTYKVDLNTLGEVTVSRHIYGFDVDGKSAIIGGSLWASYSEGNVRKNLSNASILGFLGLPDADAQRFANALNTLRLYARTYDPSRDLTPPCLTDKDTQTLFWAEFQKRAAAWRALPALPQLSDAVRKQLLLAEDAVNHKEFEAAAAAYDAGTQINPMWPEGHFNAAAIYGELKDYDDAVWHMRCYLELMPNAPDAQNARDQMLLWQAEAEQQGNAK
jgi:hypothetical protein